jgi:hypothetical protein
MRCAATAATNARRRANTSVCGVELLAYEAHEALKAILVYQYANLTASSRERQLQSRERKSATES